jgi:hypothetical protein
LLLLPNLHCRTSGSPANSGTRSASQRPVATHYARCSVHAPSGGYHVSHAAIG